MTAFLVRTLLLGATLLGSAIPHDRGRDARPAAVGYEIEIEIESVMTHPYFGFEFRMLSVGATEAPRRTDITRVRAGGTLRFKGTDEELQARGFKGSDEELAALRGAKALLQGDCAHISRKEVDVRVRLGSEREWTTATVTYGRFDVLRAVCE